MKYQCDRHDCTQIGTHRCILCGDKWFCKDHINIRDDGPQTCKTMRHK